jgi:hypothetical protein
VAHKRQVVQLVVDVPIPPVLDLVDEAANDCLVLLDVWLQLPIGHSASSLRQPFSTNAHLTAARGQGAPMKILVAHLPSPVPRTV